MKIVARWLVLIGVLILAWSAVRVKPAKRSSLLLITVDTLRADRVGVYGSTLGLTPAIDALARGGWVFEHTVASVPLTLPSHATILSGLYPFHHGVRNNGTYVFPDTRETLATRLKSAGYLTGAFVSAVVLDRRFGLARGFDVYEDRITRVSEGRNVLESERSCDVVAQKATAWIQTQAEPFFAWVHLYEPHAPYAPPAELAARHPSSPYDAEVATADRCVGTLLAAAQARAGKGLITAVTSDHGEGLGEHGESTHGLFVYQSTLSVPMIISGAKVPAGKRTQAIARSADLAPTLLSLVGVAPLDGIDGRDLTKVRAGEEAYAESDYATGFGWSRLRAWRLGRLKFIDAPRPELYDLVDDPKEERNMAPEKAEDVSRFQGILKAALATEVRDEGQRLSREAEERLRSLGYVASAPATRTAASDAMDPKDALPLLQSFERATAAENAGDLKSSIAELSALVKQAPANATFQSSLASALRRSGQTTSALQVLKRATLAAPDNAELAHDLAIALSEAGDDLQSIEYEKRALAIDPRLVDALDHLATLLATRGDLDGARKAADAALALDANNVKAWVNRGNISRAQNRMDDAEHDYGRAQEIDPNDVDSLNGLGVLAVQNGRQDEAASLFDQALLLKNDLHEARLNLAVVEAQRGNSARAIALAEDVQKRTPDAALRAKSVAFLRALRTASN